MTKGELYGCAHDAETKVARKTRREDVGEAAPASVSQTEVQTALVMSAQTLRDHVKPGDPNESSPRPRAGAHCVFVIDDNRDSADSMAEILRILGYDVSVAYSGEDALHLAQSRTPDAILCDIRMPGGMDGYDVAQAIRRDPQLQQTHLVAVTGYGQQEDRLRALSAGFDEHLTKPVELERLRTVLEEGR